MIVYLCTCLVSRKSYVGVTTASLKRRKIQHLSDARKHRCNSVLHAAIRKYGEKSFVWEVLERVMFVESMFALESYYIEKFNTRSPFGYNLTLGGEGNSGYKWNEESKKKLSIARSGERHHNFGKHLSEETRRKIGDAHRGDKNINFGKHLSESTRSKMAIARTGKKLTPERIKKTAEWHIGKKRSDVSRKRMSVAQKIRFARERGEVVQ
jgi:group I intron endonuclease